MIYFPGIDDYKSQAVGNKAARLNQLKASGFPVPPGLMLPTAVFDQSLTPYWPAIQSLLAGADMVAEIGCRAQMPCG